MNLFRGSVSVIAEPGSTPEGRRDAFSALVGLAATVGCDVFKNQWVSNPQRLCDRRRAPEYLKAYEKISYPASTHEWLADLAHQSGLAYACSVYLPGDVQTVAPYCDFLKCASFEASDPEMHSALWPYRDKTIVSLGMDGNAAAWGGFYARLHCISSYPAPITEMNLRRIGVLDGLSDHSKHPQTGAYAVCAGAQIIEFHIRLSDTDPQNADYAVARDPEEAREYVRNIRFAEAAMGDGQRRVMPSEEKMLRYRVKP